MTGSPYDLAILGGGPAGYAAALRARGEGAKVALVEMERLGGTCLNRGCIPTKCFCHSTRVYSNLKKKRLPEICLDNLKLDYQKMLQRKDEVVATLRDGLRSLMEKAGISIIDGRGFVEKDHTVSITSGPSKGSSIRSPMLLIATGSSPATLPFIPQDPRILDTDTIWDLKEVPSRLLIIGAGVIGIEAASIYSHLCDEVSVVEILPEILTGIRKSFKRLVAKSLSESKVRIITGKKIVKITAGEELKVTLDGKDEALSCDAILVAVGRKPNIKGIFDPSLDIQEQAGALKVGDDMQTSAKGIYAAGDVIGNPMLAHVASREAIAAVNNGLGFERGDRVDYGKVPEVIFSDPEIAQIGILPESASGKDGAIKTGRFPYITSSKAMCEGETEGFVEVAYDGSKGSIVGAGIVGAHASDLLAEMIVALYGGISPHLIEKSIHPHPTLSEMVWEACADSIGKAIYKIRNK